jgi:DNA-binding MarR family transcriptional regulator
VTRHYENHFRGSGLRATQFTVLAILAQTGPLPISELSNLMGIERTTLSRNLRLLEKNGWIAAADDNDHRLRKMALTQAGRRAASVALPRWRRAQARVGPVLKRFGLESSFSGRRK